MGAYQLFKEVMKFVALSAIPTEQTRRDIRNAALITYFRCPALALPFFLAGLHWQWIPGSIIAAALLVIPVVVLELARRMAKSVMISAEKLINLSATPHIWFAIINLWLALIQPAEEDILLVYTAGILIILFMVVMGRWGKSPKWYRGLTTAGLIIPAVYAVVMLIGSAAAPATFAGIRTRISSADLSAATQIHGANFDQNIVRSTQTAIGINNNGDPVEIPAGEMLWRSGKRHKKMGGDMYYAYYYRRLGNFSQSDQKNGIWFPETKVTPERTPTTKMVHIPANTNYRPDNQGKPGNKVMHIQVPLKEAEVTSLCSYVDGTPLYFGRIRDQGQTYEVWWEVPYNSL